jgi:hypothetical protein
VALEGEAEALRRARRAALAIAQVFWGKPVIYVASKQGVVAPGIETKIHFDIHKNINFFTNHQELEDKIRITFNKNRAKLLARPSDANAVEAAAA